MRSSAAPVNKTTDLSPVCLSVHRCSVQSVIRNFCEGNADVVIPLFPFYATNPRVKHSVSFLGKLFNFHVINRVLCRHWQLKGNNRWWFHRPLLMVKRFGEASWARAIGPRAGMRLLERGSELTPY